MRDACEMMQNQIFLIDYLACLHLLLVHDIISVKSDKLQKRKSGCDSQVHLHFYQLASTVPERLLGAQQGGQYACFHRNS